MIGKDIKRVLYLGGFELPDKNAAAQRVMSNAMLLREMGYNVSFVGISKEGGHTFTYNGLDCRCLKYPIGMKTWLYHVVTFLPVSEIEKYNPNYIILYNFPAVACLKILSYARKHGIKVIHDVTEWEQTDGWSPRDVIKRIDTWFRMRYCMKRMDGIIAISRYLYEFYRDDVPTILVPPTIDLNNPKWMRDRKLEACSPITLVYAGSPGSGVKDRLDLIIDEIRDFPNMKLIVVGVTAEQFFSAFRRRYEEIPNISFKGRLSHLEAVKAVCDSDFQMLIRNHSRKNDAGFPTKLAESMACRTPIIATNFSNISDYVMDGVNAFLVDDTRTLHDVFEQVSNMSQEDIVAMKQHCMDIRDFDYRQYKSEFKKIFKWIL